MGHTQVAKDLIERFKIVGIGASAGGSQAVADFFSTASPDQGLVYVIVQHTNSDSDQAGINLLRRYTTMPVVVVDKPVALQENTIYLTPPDNGVTIADNRILPVKQNARTHMDFPIDTLFKSMASQFKEKAVAVVLSGTGTDGARGVKEIKDKGGVVMVQSPDSARFDSMPYAVITQGLEDVVLTPGEMPHEIVRIDSVNSQLIREGIAYRYNQRVVKKILKMIQDYSGISFEPYRKSTIYRRIDKRIKINNLSNPEEYLELLCDNNGELGYLSRDLLIGVTTFFRDREAFDLLEKTVIPQMFSVAREKKVIRIWSVGCSTGQEVYSIAMLLNEYIEQHDLDYTFKIFATNINKFSVEYAGSGIYQEEEVKDVPEHFKDKYFTSCSGEYRIKKDLRTHIVFATCDVLQDPPFIKIDLLVCRNLLIYMEPRTQKKLLLNFHFSLNEGGYLFLGSSETLGGLKNAFREVAPKWKIFKNVLKASVPPGRAILGNQNKLLSPIKRGKKQSELHQKMNYSENRSIDVFSDLLVQEYVPTCLFVNRQFDVLYVNGAIDTYLSFPQKMAKMNILNMVGSEESLLFRNGVRKVEENKESVVYRNMPFTKDDAQMKVDIKIGRHDHRYLEEPTFLIEICLSNSDACEGKEMEITEETFRDERIDTLEKELRESRQETQSLVEQLEASNEELQASNEELLAANEELQSTNEEMQSVNAELQSKIMELTTVNNDISNLLNSTDLGTVFLDQDLKIRRFTPAIKEHFYLTDGDIGRPIEHFAGNIVDCTIPEDSRKVLKSIIPLEKEIQNDEGRYYIQRVQPYRTIDNAIEGVVITFFDITERKKLELQIQDSNELFQLAVEGSKDGIWDWPNVAVDKQWWSSRFYELIGYTPEELPVNLDNFQKILHPEDQDIAQDAGNELFVNNVPFDVEYRINTKHNGYRWFRAKAALKRDESGAPLRMVGSVSDVHDQKMAEEEIRRQNEKLQKTNKDLEQFAYVATHDLRAPAINLKVLLELFTSTVELDKEQREILDKIERSSDQLNETLHDLIDIISLKNRSEENTSRLQFEKLVENITQPIHDQYNVTPVLRVDFDKAQTIEYLPGHLKSIIYNLYSNAVKYRSPERPLEVDITTEKKESYVVLTMRDNGIGFDTNKLPKVFGLFQRLSNKVGGKGIGLYAIKSLIESKGGRIEAYSKPGEGAEFKVYLKQQQK